MISYWRKLVDWFKRNHVKSKEEYAALHSKYKDVFGTDKGMDVLADLCRRNYVFDNNVLVPGDAGSTQFREGRRDAIMRILTFIENDPEIYKQNKEQNDETTP